MSANVSLILSELQATKAEVLSLKSQMSSLQSLLSSKLSVAASSAGGETPAKGKKAKKEKKERDPDAEPRAPTAWRLFTELVGTLLKTEGYSGKDLAVGNLQFCATLKKENEDIESWAEADILARRAAWTAPEPKTKEEKASSYAYGRTVEEKPFNPMENRINDIIVALGRMAETLKIQRREKEERDARWAEEAKRREIQESIRRQEQQRMDKFTEWADKWHRSIKLAAFLKELETTLSGLPEDHEAWEIYKVAQKRLIAINPLTNQSIQSLRPSEYGYYN
jgi:hypothetical protein